MPKKVLIALPPAMLEQIDFIAKCEHRTRSDLIREALRRYLDNFRRTQGVSLSIVTEEAPVDFRPPSDPVTTKFEFTKEAPPPPPPRKLSIDSTMRK